MQVARTRLNGGALPQLLRFHSTNSKNTGENAQTPAATGRSPYVLVTREGPRVATLGDIAIPSSFPHPKDRIKTREGGGAARPRPPGQRYPGQGQGNQGPPRQGYSPPGTARRSPTNLTKHADAINQAMETTPSPQRFNGPRPPFNQRRGPPQGSKASFANPRRSGPSQGPKTSNPADRKQFPPRNNFRGPQSTNFKGFFGKTSAPPDELRITQPSVALTGELHQMFYPSSSLAPAAPPILPLLSLSSNPAPITSADSPEYQVVRTTQLSQAPAALATKERASVLLAKNSTLAKAQRIAFLRSLNQMFPTQGGNARIAKP